MFHDPAQRTFAIGVWIASFSAGGAIGPLVGGVLLGWFWWGSVFLVAVPVMALLLAVGPFLLPEFRDPDAGRMDIASAVMSLAAVLAVIYGMKSFAAEGAGWTPALFVVAGLALGAAFLSRQRRLAEPLIDLSLFRRPAFSVSLVINILAFFVAFGSFLLIAQYLQLVLELTPLAAGLWSAPSGIAFIVGSMATGALVARIRPAYAMAGGLLVAAAGFALLAVAGGAGNLALVVAAFTILSLGLAPAFTLTTDLIVGTVPAERAGIASGLSETSAELGGALGIALLGSIVTAVYRALMAAAEPGGVPAEALARARDTLGGAVSIAAGLPEPAGGALAGAAREAFIEGFVFAALLCTAIALATALLAVAVLRRTGRPEPEEPAPAPAR